MWFWQAYNLYIKCISWIIKYLWVLMHAVTMKIPTTMFINITIFWDVKSCGLVHRHQYFRGTYCFNPEQRHSIWGRVDKAWDLSVNQWQWSGVIKKETRHHLRFSLMCFLQLHSSLITNFLTLSWNIFHTCFQKSISVAGNVLCS